MILLGKHINKYYKKYWYMFLGGVAAVIFADVMNLFVPDKLGDIVGLMNQYSKTPTQELISQIGWIALQVLGVGALLMLGRILWRIFLFRSSIAIQNDLRKEMFEKAERLSVSYYHQEKMGNILAWFTTDIETIEEYLGFGTVMLIDSTFLTVMVIIKMFTISVPLSLLVALPSVLIIVWGAFSDSFLTKTWDSRQKANDRLYDFTTESFAGIRVIKAFVKENQQLRAFDRIAKDCEKKGVKVTVVNTGMERLIDSLIYIIFGLLLGVGGFYIYNESTGGNATLFGMAISLSVSDLVKFIAYYDTLIWPIIALGSVITTHSRAKASLSRVSAFLDQTEEIELADGHVELKEPKGEIEFNHFYFTFPGTNAPILQDISLHIKAGESVGVIGKIGCGKTILMDCLLRLYNVDANSIKIDGNDIMSLKIASLRDAISYVPQDNFLFSDTIENNIAFSLKEDDPKKVQEAARFASIEQDILSFPNQYQSMLGERGTTVSGGQKQRISMARAYLKNAAIMIMDDSVSAVDVKTEESILKHIKEDRAGKTTILIASRISTVSHLDKVIVLNDGKLEAFDTPENLLATSKTYARMALLQELEKEADN